MKTTTMTYKGVDLVIDYEFSKGEDEVNAKPTVDIFNIKIGFVDVTDLLDCEISSIEDEILNDEVG